MIGTPCPHDDKPCPVCAGLDAYKPPTYNPDGSCNEVGMAEYWLEKYLESLHEIIQLQTDIHEMRSSGMRGLRSDRTNDKLNVEETDTWTI